MSTAQTTDVDLDAIDVLDARWFADGTPHELFARMRAEAPVRWNPLPDGTGCWSVTRHADVSAISRDTETFSSYKAGIFLHPDQVVGLDLTRNLLLYMDPPQHTKYRLILQKAFTPHTVQALEDGIRARVTKTLDRIVEAGSCDVVDDIAVPIPLGVLTELMGVPEEDIAEFYTWTEEIEAAQRAPEPNAAAEVFVKMAGYLHGQIERQAAEGNEDSLVMKLRAAEVDGEKLTDPEILVFFGLLAFAGNDTTRNTLANGLHALLEHPDQLQELVEDPSLIPGAVEEILRYTSVVRWFVRTATTDTELGGQSIREGDRVVMWYASASFDDEVFDEPTRFDIHRVKPEHKAFGGGGRHFCLGAGLARAELRIALEEITRRLRDLQPAGPVERLPSSWANGLVHFPVTFTPGARAGDTAA
ncbi:cytochrome P450 [Paraconexibacter algicola]|uniref:Cytochrome P450 n=1 Tax=Paraconexibacter algicola TaxID=2133960 RepID=A0A2T4UN52_9ACTN|nr:cytochrome P450 [Paraconexibacter algicola]PTL60670.1 cytochrome P450 [Paraconexibacter algicola]